MASVLERHARDRSVRASWRLCAALLLSQEAQFARQLPNVSDRDGYAADGPGPQTGTRRGWQADHQLDAASANLLRTRRGRRDGRAHGFAAYAGMPQGR